MRMFNSKHCGAVLFVGERDGQWCENKRVSGWGVSFRRSNTERGWGTFWDKVLSKGLYSIENAFRVFFPPY